MGEKVLSYIQDRIAKLWRFKAQKVKKNSRRRLSSLLQAWFMVNGLFWMWQRMVSFSAGTNGE